MSHAGSNQCGGPIGTIAGRTQPAATECTTMLHSGLNTCLATGMHAFAQAQALGGAGSGAGPVPGWGQGRLGSALGGAGAGAGPMPVGWDGCVHVSMGGCVCV